MFKILEPKTFKYATDKQVNDVNRVAYRLNEFIKEAKFSAKTKAAIKDLENIAANVFQNKSWSRTKWNLIRSTIEKESGDQIKILVSLLTTYFDQLLALKRRKFLWWIV